MDYLYSESVLSSPVSHALLTDDFIVAHHHSTLRLYDHRFNLIAEKYFYERILDIKKIGAREIAVLFSGNKLVQMTYEFEPVALRMVRGGAMDAHSTSASRGATSGAAGERNLVMVWDEAGMTVFSCASSTHQTIKFHEIGICGAEHVVFLENYIPTLLIVWRAPPLTRCALLAVDGAEVVEDFELVDGIIGVCTHSRFIVFFHRSFIQVRFKRDVYTLVLGETLPPPHASVVYVAAETPLGTIALENPCAAFDGDVMHLVNGDGRAYRVEFEYGAKRITKAAVYLEGVSTVPACMAAHGGQLLIGSVEASTALYSFRAHVQLSDAAATNKGLLESTTASDILASTEHLELRAVLHHAGLVSNLSVQSNGLVLTASRKILFSSSVIHFQALEKARLPFNPATLAIENGAVVVCDGTTKQAVLTGCSEKQPRYAASLSAGMLIVSEGAAPVYTASGVASFSIDQDLLFYTTASAAVLVSLCMNKIVFSNSSFYAFPNMLYNEPVVAPQMFEEVEKQHEGAAKERADVVEVLVRSDVYPLVLIRTAQQLYVYRLVGGYMRKVFVPKYLAFDNQRSLFDMGSCVYIRSRTPYMLFTRGGLFMHQCNCRFSHGVADAEHFYFVHRGSLIKTRLPGGPSTRYDCDVILRETDIEPADSTVSPAVPNSQSNDASAQKENMPGVEPVLVAGKLNEDMSDGRVISDMEPNRPQPRFSVSTGGSSVVAVAKSVPFKYEPFIPMVHMSNGPGCPPISEPIGLEPDFSSGPLVLGRTLRYHLELYNSAYTLLHSLPLDENELVCDMCLFQAGLVVVCTAFPEGEEKAVKGRILVYAVRDIVPDPRRPLVNKKLALIAAESLRAPCLSAAEVRGLLAVCVGTRLMVYEVDTTVGVTATGAIGGIQAVGRNEIALLTVDLFVVENFIAALDLNKGLRFFFLRPRDPLRIHLLSQSEPISLARSVQGIMLRAQAGNAARGDTAAGADQLSLVVYDSLGTHHVYTYSPLYLASGNGSRLIKRAEIRANTTGLYSATGTFCRRSNTYASVHISNNIASVVCPIPPSRSAILQGAIAFHVPDTCGINAQNYLSPEGHVNIECRGVTSERLLLEFFHMEPSLQRAVLDMAGFTWSEAMGIFDAVLGH
ncbi:hypothetical protein PAPHI01_0699 [Pancytospora philotis]|nr:hypothetical protein PAPHI01_0699 [Pancytospora philotis]